MQEIITPYLKELAKNNPAVQLQFYKSCQEEESMSVFSSDPLEEDSHEIVKGLVHKYSNRVLIKTTLRCAAHCRFCTRYRQVGSIEGDLQSEDIDRISSYISDNPQIDDVILSGGDPLYAPKTAIKLLNKLKDIRTIKVFRVGTRLPVHNPQSFDTPLVKRVIETMDEIAEDRPFLLPINFQHPSELTKETLNVLKNLRRTNLTLLSQTVFLKGINNSEIILKELFRKLYHSGVIPYYIYRCDYVKGVERFICDIKEEQEIITKLRSTLSGIACPTYVVDVAGQGKIPVPLGYWENTNLAKCKDYNGKNIDL